MLASVYKLVEIIVKEIAQDKFDLRYLGCSYGFMIMYLISKEITTEWGLFLDI